MNRKPRTLLKASSIFFFLVAAFMAYCHIETYLLETIELDYSDPDVPASFDGKRIVYVSDIHHGSFFPRDRVASLVDRINELEPDIVLLGGDYITGHSPEGSIYIEPVFEELSRINATYGIYGVRGNHDNWVDPPAVEKAMGSAGITPLDNRGQWITLGDGRIKIGGVGDLQTDSQYLTPTVEDTKDEDFVILLSHNPDYAETLKDSRVDLVLSGHTHGGQITFFGLYAPYRTTRYGEKYNRGLVENGDTKVFVSKGASQSIPLRFFARPDIVVIDLKREG